VRNDCRPFARDPDLGLPRLVVRVSTVLPVPAQALGIRGIGAMRPSIERVDAATVVRPEPIDFGHEIAIL